MLTARPREKRAAIAGTPTEQGDAQTARGSITRTWQTGNYIGGREELGALPGQVKGGT